MMMHGRRWLVGIIVAAAFIIIIIVVVDDVIVDGIPRRRLNIRIIMVVM